MDGSRVSDRDPFTLIVMLGLVIALLLAIVSRLFLQLFCQWTEQHSCRIECWQGIHCFGGVIAQYFATDFPNKVEKLVVLSSLAKTELPPDIQWKLDNLLPIVENVGKFFPSLAQVLFAQIHVYDVVEPQEPAYLIKEASFAHFHSVMKRIRIVSKLDIVDRVSRINVPTLIMYGSDDHFTRKDSFRLHTLIRTSKLLALPGGHLCHITNPKLFAEQVREFLYS